MTTIGTLSSDHSNYSYGCLVMDHVKWSQIVSAQPFFFHTLLLCMHEGLVKQLTFQEEEEDDKKRSLMHVGKWMLMQLRRRWFEPHCYFWMLKVVWPLLMTCAFLLREERKEEEGLSIYNWRSRCVSWVGLSVGVPVSCQFVRWGWRKRLCQLLKMWAIRRKKEVCSTVDDVVSTVERGKLREAILPLKLHKMWTMTSSLPVEKVTRNRIASWKSVCLFTVATMEETSLWWWCGRTCWKLGWWWCALISYR